MARRKAQAEYTYTLFDRVGYVILDPDGRPVEEELCFDAREARQAAEQRIQELQDES